MERTIAIIAEGTTIVGIVRGGDDIDLRGKVFGELSARNVLVASGAAVSGQLVGLQITVEGKATGRIRAQNLRVTQTALVDADTSYGDLNIEQGANITGRFEQLANQLDPREFEYLGTDGLTRIHQDHSRRHWPVAKARKSR